MTRAAITILSAAMLLPSGAAAQAPSPVVSVRVPAHEAFAQSAAAAHARERAREQQERARLQQQQHRERRRAMRDREYPAEQTERLSRTLKVGSRGEVVIANLTGDIIVSRGGSEVQVEAVKTARGRTDEDAREMLSLVQVEFAERGGRGEARVVYQHEGWKQKPNAAREHRRHINVSVAFNVTAPEHTRLTIKSLSGDIRVTDIKGELSLLSTSGDVSIANAGRVLSAKSTSGDVEITNTTSENAIEANTLSGDLVLRQVRAPRLQLGTISGKVLIQDVESARIEAQSLSGDVELNTPLARNGRYDLNSHSGDVSIAIAGNVGFELDANTFSGAVRSDVTLKGTEVVGASDRRGRARSLRGIFGDGDALLDVTTFSGNVIVTKR